MKWAALALFPLLLWACESGSLPAPAIVSVEPESVPADSPSVLSIKVSAVLPVAVDYQEQAVDPAQLAITLWVAGQVVDVPFIERDGTLLAPVPEGLALGDYDIRLALADGREAVREHAFSVVPPPTLTQPASELSFQIDPIADQVRGAPFRVTIRAVGPGASTFQDTVTLRASKGAMPTRTTGAFAAGVREEEITLSHPSPSIYLLVEDAQGHKGLSKSFRVRPH